MIPSFQISLPDSCFKQLLRGILRSRYDPLPYINKCLNNTSHNISVIFSISVITTCVLRGCQGSSSNQGITLCYNNNCPNLTSRNNYFLSSVVIRTPSDLRGYILVPNTINTLPEEVMLLPLSGPIAAKGHPPIKE